MSNVSTAALESPATAATGRRPVTDRTARPATALHTRCSHCDGSGREPAPLSFDFSLSGERRGELNRLSERTGLAPSTISRMLSGSSVPGLLSVVLVAEALECSESRIIHSPAVWMRVMAELSE